MSLIFGDLYKALRQAGASEEDAEAAAHEVAIYVLRSRSRGMVVDELLRLWPLLVGLGAMAVILFANMILPMLLTGCPHP